MEIIDLSGTGLPEKEQKILEAAIQVFSEKGFSASTTSEIAKSAGVAEGTIFRYFKTKKDILRGILIQAINLIGGKLVVDGLEKIMEDVDEKDLKTALKQLLYDRLSLAESLFPMARVVLTEAVYHEDVREALYQNIIARALELAEKFHDVMIKKGMLREDINHEIFFRTIIGNIAALAVQRLMFGDKFKLKDLDREIDMMIDILMYGVAKRKPEYGGAE